MDEKDLEPIAIVGFSFRYPQDAISVQGFWEMLANGRCAMTKIPEDRWNADAFTHPDPSRRSGFATKGGHFIKENLGAFDAQFFSISPEEAIAMDPHQRIILEETYRAFENSGIPIEKVKGTNVSVHTSSFADDYRLKSFRDPNNLPKYCSTGTEIGMLANRVSWFYDFHGPSVNVDSACAGGLVALDHACATLRNRDATMSVVAAGALVIDPENIVSLANMGFLSPDSRCFSYDSRANGYAKGEGVGVVVLQRLSDAVKSGNSIRAVIRATSTNSNGNNAGITQPSQTAQESLIKRTYKKAGLTMMETKYVEGHGTGTAIGDIAEANTLGTAFLNRPGSEALYIGCVKSNIGHLEGGAGIAGIIKTILVLESGVIPPNTNFKACGPQINLEKLKIRFPVECTPWPAVGLRRASVNSFGFGGSGAHAVLDDAYNFCRIRGIKAKHHTRLLPPSTLELHDTTYASDFFRITHVQDKAEALIYKNGTLETAECAVASKVDINDSFQGRETRLVDNLRNNDFSKNGSYASQEDAAQRVSPVNILHTPALEEIDEANYGTLPRLFTLSANDQDGIKRISQAYQEHFNSLPLHLVSRKNYINDLSYTLNARSSLLTWRSFALLGPCDDLSCFQELLKGPIRSKISPHLSFVFSGQGAQWPRMGRELLAYDVFSSSLRFAQETLSGFGCSWLLLDELSKENDLSKIHDAELSQPICTALQIALIDLLRSLSVIPSLVIGHSSGEIAGAYAIGALSSESALRISFHRGRLAAKLSKSNENPGRMMVVRLSETELIPYFSRLTEISGKCEVSIACYNSPRSLTLSGNKEQLEALKSILESENVLARELRVGVAYHSFHMHSIAEEYLSSIQNITADSFHKSRAVMVSSVTTQIITHQALRDPEYWVANMLSAVRFGEVVGRICQVSERDPENSGGIPFTNHFLEIGPHSVLQGPIRESSETNPGSEGKGYNSVLRRGSSATETFLNSLGHLFSAGFPVDFSNLHRLSSTTHEPQLLIDLPQYPFDHSESYLINGRLDQSYRMRRYPRNELLGTATIDWNSHDAVWSNFFRPSEMPWLNDHKINGSVLYPAPGMLVMAIEAMFQVVPEVKDVSALEMRNVVFCKTLLIPEDGKETRFSLRRLRDSANKWSLWYEFILYFYEDLSFHENCRGEIRAEYDSVKSDNMGYQKEREKGEISVEHFQVAKKNFSARVQQKRFYDHLAKCGLNYGTSFQRLQNIRYDKESRTHARSEVKLFETNELSIDRVATHVIHPTSLDAIAHSIFIPLTHGATSMMATNIPTRLDRIWVSKNGLRFPESVAVDVHSDCKKTGPRTASSNVTVFEKDTSKSLLVMNGLQTSIVADMEIYSLEDNERFCFSVDSKPDVTLFEPKDMEEYFSPRCHMDGSIDFFDKLTSFLLEAILNAKAGLADLDRGTLPDHLKKYLAWMDRLQFDCDDAKNLESQRLLYNKERSTPIKNLAQELSSVSALGKLFTEVGVHLESIIRGETNLHEFLFSGSLAKDYYQEVYESTNLGTLLAEYLELLAHKNPNLNILEIGAGTAGATAAVLDTLHVPSEEGSSDKEIDRFSRYTFTDVSPYFFEGAKERLGAQSKKLEFALYDIERSPESQGLELGTYDLVVAFSVLHLADDLEFAIQGARKLLKTGGKLIMSEIVRPDILRGSFIWGLFPGWWRGTETYREWGPCISESRWSEVLTANGFTGIDHSVCDFKNKRCHEMSMIISTAIETNLPSITLPAINVIIDDSSKLQFKIATLLKSTLMGPDFDISSYSITSFEKLATSPAVPESCYIFLADLDGSKLFDMTSVAFEILHNFFLSANRVLWVTNKGGPVKVPSTGIIDGLSRVLRSERSELTMTTLALELLDSDASLATNHIAKLVSRSKGLSQVETLEEEYEKKNGLLEIKRLVEEPAIKNIMTNLHAAPQVQEESLENNTSLYLSSGPTGLISNLVFVEDKINSPLSTRDIEIKVHAVGLNSSDYLAATGKLDRNWLGSDCAGVVTSSKDASFVPGDLVVACGTSTTRTIFHTDTNKSLIAKIPAGIDFVTAASFPTRFTLAHYALVQVAGISSGDSILIHSASSGVGQAAIQIAHHYGATVYATVSSREKKEFLTKCFNLSESRIMSSRDTSFSKAVKVLTEGEGVDFVLCPFLDDRSDASMDCLSSSGHYLDIALGVANRKVQVQGENMFYSRINFGSIIQSRPQVIRSSFYAVLSLLAESKLDMTSFIHIFPASRVVKAFSNFQDEARIGSNVLEFKTGDSIQFLFDKAPRVNFDPNSTYLISGGLGGIGRDIASWMVQCGARHLVLLSRSGPKGPTEDFVKLLQGQGVTLETPACDISSEVEVKAALKKCAAMPPIRGCIQAAVVMEDLTFARMRVESWRKVVNPKMQGSWNLHKFLPVDMDFFIMMSSMIGIIGNVSQASYAAGNTYQDSLAHYRRSKGQNATSLNLGPVSEIGQLAEEEGLRAKVESTGHFTMLSSNDIHAMLAYYIQGCKGPQLLTGIKPRSRLINENKDLPYWIQRPLFTYLQSLARHSVANIVKTTSTTDLSTIISQASDNDVEGLVTNALLEKLSRTLSIPLGKLDPLNQMSAFGIDSLFSVDLRNWFIKELQADIAIFDIMGSIELRGLARLVTKKSKLRGPSGT